MDQDTFTDALAPDDQTQRRSFGGLGRGPVALLVAAGLLIVGGIGGFVASSTASSVSTMASHTLTTSHTCPSMGRATAN